VSFLGPETSRLGCQCSNSSCDMSAKVAFQVILGHGKMMKVNQFIADVIVVSGQRK